MTVFAVLSVLWTVWCLGAFFLVTGQEKEYESVLGLVAGAGALMMYEKVWQLGVDAAWAKLMSLAVVLSCAGILAVSLYIRKRLQRAQCTAQQREKRGCDGQGVSQPG